MLRRLVVRCLFPIVLIAGPTNSALNAQQQRADIRGIVRGPSGPLADADVFVAGTLDGARSDSGGHFSFHTPRQQRYTIIARREGFALSRTEVADSNATAVVVVLEPGRAQMLAPVLAVAGRYSAADEPGATLTPLEIVTTPGTAANVNRAIQTLPGVQQVNEGTGLFVRGGDYTETRVFLNDAPLLNPAQLQSPAGTFVGTFDPFLLDAVYFRAGGFGARYGDALSAIVALRTQARPESATASLSAGLAAFAADVALPGPRGTALRLVANRDNLSPVLRLNGSTRQFSVAPRGADLTASGYWNYRPTAEVKLFATQQDETLAALNETPSIVDTFSVARRDRAAVLSWHDVFGRVAPTAVVSSSLVRDTQRFGAFELASPQRLDAATAMAESEITERFTVRAGVEAARVTSGVSGSVPASGADQRPGARVRLYDIRRATDRRGAFVELDARPAESARLIAGGRVDRASSTGRTTFDPRVSGAWRIPFVTLTSAWGIYHQSPDPLLATLRDSGYAVLPAMRATQTIAGVQVGDSDPTIRIELYHKTYTDLVQQTRDFVTVAGGTGRANGVDVMLRAPGVGGLSSRVVYSLVDAVRTDPSTGVMAHAPFDVTHSVTAVATQLLPEQMTVGVALRYASGAPFTPVVSARPPARAGGEWTPTYGAPGSLRLPAYARLDFSFDWFRVVRPGMQTVFYLAVSNALGRANVFTWTYTPDYATRYAVTSLFNRSVYFGGVITFIKQR